MTEINTFVIGGLDAETREKAIEKLRNTWRYKDLHDELHADTLYPALESHLQEEGVDFSIIDLYVDGEDVSAKVTVESGEITLTLLERIGSARFADIGEYELVRDILDYEDLYYYRTPDDSGDVYLDEIDATAVAREIYGTMVVGEMEVVEDDDFEDAFVAAMSEYESEIHAAMESLREAIYTWLHDIIDDFEEEARHTVATSEDDFIIDALCEETRFLADGTPTEVA